MPLIKINVVRLHKRVNCLEVELKFYYIPSLNAYKPRHQLRPQRLLDDHVFDLN